MTGTSILSSSFNSSERACTKHLNSSGDMGCPCSVPQRTSIFSESLLRSFIFAEEWVYNVHCTMYIVQCTMYMCNVQCTMYIVQCTMYMCNVQCTMYNVQCTMYNVHCTLYNVKCTLYNVHVFHTIKKTPLNSELPKFVEQRVPANSVKCLCIVYKAREDSFLFNFHIFFDACY